MRAFALLLAAALIAGPAVVSFPRQASAQTSFGAAPVSVQNREEWSRATAGALEAAMRRMGSSLVGQGHMMGISLEVGLVIARDGSVRQANILRSSGRPSIDAAVQRGFSRDLGIPPFSSDMTDDSVSLVLPMGTVRH
ncbi:hypothetical protein [Paracoccus zeaxanthinifaciens]|uniref:hypothetical protein n=1 Tax=Paracoccus zeaxanthinifaciens TaxID=187400 RepID=UPI0003B6E825|nr:hypothetical protein [Paracoccus zeaxanthinifaciens]